MKASMSERQYPIRPAPDDDPRFTRGLALDVTEVLLRHGYPPLSGMDHVELQQALFRFLYADTTAQGGEPDGDTD